MTAPSPEDKLARRRAQLRASWQRFKAKHPERVAANQRAQSIRRRKGTGKLRRGDVESEVFPAFSSRIRALMGLIEDAAQAGPIPEVLRTEYQRLRSPRPIESWDPAAVAQRGRVEAVLAARDERR